MAWDRDGVPPRPSWSQPGRPGMSRPPTSYQRYGLPAGASDAAASPSRSGPGRRLLAGAAVSTWSSGRWPPVCWWPTTQLEPVTAHSPPTGSASCTNSTASSCATGWPSTPQAVAERAGRAGPDTVAKLVSLLGWLGHGRGRGRGGAAGAGVVVVHAFPALPGTPDPQLGPAPLSRRPRPAAIGRDHLRRRRAARFPGSSTGSGSPTAGGWTRPRWPAPSWKPTALPFADRAKDGSQKALTSHAHGGPRAGGLDALLLSEVVERLRQFIRLGLSGPHCLATRAIDTRPGPATKLDCWRRAARRGHHRGGAPQVEEQCSTPAGCARPSGWPPDCPPAIRCGRA